MKRFLVSGAALAALSACVASVPDSGAGIYNSTPQQQAAREAALQGLQPGTDLEAPEGATLPQQSEAEALAAATAAALNSGDAPLEASPSNPPPVAVNAAGISQENDFQDVSSLRSIETDAERLAQNRAQYQVIAPTALPARSGASGPNIVDFALNTQNAKGEALYTRGGLASQTRYARNCGKYPSPDLAQADFLANGGPERDRMGLDPDGDGFACAWDPAPFRLARQN